MATASVQSTHGTTAIVLAAGTGSRLLPHTEAIPKCLLPVAGRTLLERHLATLAELPDVTEIVVVGGYLIERVEAELARLAPETGPAQLLYNPFFASTNALFSLWLALQRRPPSFVVLNADTMMQRQTVRQLLAAMAEHDAVLAVDRGGLGRPDAVRVQEAAGIIAAAGKQVPRQVASAESLGLAGFTRAAALQARVITDQLLRGATGTSDHWHALVDAMAAQREVRTVDCSGCAWLEIDTVGDLRSAQHLADLISPSARVVERVG